MDDVELRDKIRESVRDKALESALIQLVALRNAMRELSHPSVLVQRVSGFPLKKADLEGIKRVVAAVEDEELRRELEYLLNLGEDIQSGKLLRDLLFLSEMEERLHLLGIFLVIVAGLTPLAYWFLSDYPEIRPFVLALAFIGLLAGGYVFLKAFLSKRELLKSLTLRYKLK